MALITYLNRHFLISLCAIRYSLSIVMPLEGKRILIGLSGGIACYKVPELIRRLKDRGADVKVVMTASAKAFITPLTLQAVSGEPVHDDLLDPSAEAAMGHIELAKWADLNLVVPATANTLAKLANGMADDLLTTLCLASDAPLAVAPAMNQQMYKALATQANLKTLAQRQVHIWGPAQGEQACGDVGPGRMLEPMEILGQIEALFADEQLLAGKRIVITAGPTREALDPVRYISNHSSGKMGFALAQAARQMGASVEIIAGPVALATPTGCERTDVVSAQDMHTAALKSAPDADVFIACAAVADYRAADVADNKIKKNQDQMHISLVKNPDIVADVAALAENCRPYTLGFAAETQDVADYARGKLKRKKLDMIAANNVAVAGQGFNAEDNQITLYWQDQSLSLPLQSKTTLAQAMLKIISEQLTNESN